MYSGECRAVVPSIARHSRFRLTVNEDSPAMRCFVPRLLLLLGRFGNEEARTTYSKWRENRIAQNS